MTVEERVADFLVKNMGKAYCNTCVARELGINHRQAQNATARPTNTRTRRSPMTTERAISPRRPTDSPPSSALTACDGADRGRGRPPGRQGSTTEDVKGTSGQISGTIEGEDNKRIGRIAKEGTWSMSRTVCTSSENSLEDPHRLDHPRSSTHGGHRGGGRETPG
jgi:hypothetical protein